jgi:hypothetical protein
MRHDNRDYYAADGTGDSKSLPPLISSTELAALEDNLT